MCSSALGYIIDLTFCQVDEEIGTKMVIYAYRQLH
jgi:hypothetical protein